MAGRSRYSRALWLLLLAALLVAGSVGRGASTASPSPQPVPSTNSFHSLDDILHYISDDWTGLRRSLTDCNTYQDVKTQGKPTLYLPADISTPPALAQMQRCHLQLKHLPATLSEEDAGKIQPRGLLYLENPYVVPGGQFNEMYGWDSYFIIRGLLREHRVELAKGMVENFFFEIEHYGGVLNANRTYYLTRSQPPFLSSMVLAVYDAEAA